MQRGRKSVRGIGATAKKTKAQVAALSGALKRLASGMLVVAGVGGFGALTSSAIAFGSAQSDIAAQLNINTVAFQTYAGAIKDAGGTQEQMRKSILSQQQAVVQGSEGLTTYTRAFERLGINVKALRGLKAEEQFQRIALAVANTADQQGALTAVSEIYGKRNAPELIEVMQRLARDGFGKLSEEIRKTYGIMDAETQRRLDAAADRIEQFKQKATINVGELIAGEADGAAVKVLTARLIGAAAKFAVSLLEALYKVGKSGPVLFGGVLEGVANKFGLSLDAVALRFKIRLKEAANAVILKLNELSGSSIGVFSLGGKDGEYRKLAEAQARAARGGDGVFDTALGKVEKLWSSSPLQGWKDDISAGTAAIAEAYQADLTASREAAKVRVDAAEKMTEIAAASAAETAAVAGSFTAQPSGGSSAAGGGEAAKAISSKWGEVISSLKKKLLALGGQSDDLRRQGDFAGSRALLDQRFGIRGQIDAAETQDRIHNIRAGVTSFRASDSYGPGGDRAFQGDDSLQSRQVELLTDIRAELLGA